MRKFSNNRTLSGLGKALLAVLPLKIALFDATTSGTVDRFVSPGHFPTHAGLDISDEGLKDIAGLHNDEALAPFDLRVGFIIAGGLHENDAKRMAAASPMGSRLPQGH